MSKNYVDLDLVDKTISLIPVNAWPEIKKAIITYLVDNMPGSALEQLTGSYEGFDEAEEILDSYYQLPALKQELIVDAFKIMGAVNCLELLSSLNLSEEDGISESNPA